MSNSNESAGDTGGGFLVGVESPQPRTANEWTQQQQRPDQAVSQPIQQQPPPQPPQSQPRFTEEDIERARQQEKDKLYPRLDEMQTQLRTLQEERQAEQAERQRLMEEAANAQRAKEEGEMEVRDLLTKREQEWEARFTEINARYDADRAVFEQERRLQEVQEYRRARIEQEANDLMPELREFITGGTPEEIDASIEAMKARTESIVANMMAAQPPPRTTNPSVPPVGPMEQLPSYETLTPAQIQAMDMDTYKRHREQLLRATNPNR